MPSAHWELQKAIHGKLVGSPEVLAILGGPNVWDHVPRGGHISLCHVRRDVRA